MKHLKKFENFDERFKKEFGEKPYSGMDLIDNEGNYLPDDPKSRIDRSHKSMKWEEDRRSYYSSIKDNMEEASNNPDVLLDLLEKEGQYIIDYGRGMLITMIASSGNLETLKILLDYCEDNSIDLNISSVIDYLITRSKISKSDKTDFIEELGERGLISDIPEERINSMIKYNDYIKDPEFEYYIELLNDYRSK